MSKYVHFVLRRKVHVSEYVGDDEAKLRAAALLSQSLNRSLEYFDSVEVEQVEELK